VCVCVCKLYLFLFEYAIMFVKVQIYLKFSKVIKIRHQIAPDLNGLRPLKCVLVSFLVHLISKSMFVYDLLLNRFQSMISQQRVSPASFGTLRKQTESS
jgi:hypothetical protein